MWCCGPLHRSNVSLVVHMCSRIFLSRIPEKIESSTTSTLVMVSHCLEKFPIPVFHVLPKSPIEDLENAIVTCKSSVASTVRKVGNQPCTTGCLMMRIPYLRVNQTTVSVSCSRAGQSLVGTIRGAGTATMHSAHISSYIQAP